MPEFTKYMHLERIDTQETADILNGTIHIFPKIDGTNASVWVNFDTEEIQAGSRNRELSVESDNAGFHRWVTEQREVGKWGVFDEYPDWILYGEWLVPHSLKTYRDDAWRDFYVFDVLDTTTGLYLSYDTYKPVLEAYGINYIPPIAIIHNAFGSKEKLVELLDRTGYLLKDGETKGEGIVIKRYDFVNKYGRTVWAKMITNEFKEKHHKEMGAPEINGTRLIEQDIIDEFLTEEFILKEKAKLEIEDGWHSKLIPKLLGVVFYEFIREETWNWVKKYKNPQGISFSLLNKLCIEKTKRTIGL